MKYLFWMAWVISSGAACATPQKPVQMPSGPYVAVTPQPAPKPIVKVVPVPYAQPVPGQAKRMPKAKPTEAQIEQAKQSPAQVLKQANANARHEPAPEGFFNAIQVYDYMPGALYQVYAAPNHITAILFEPGERLLTVHAGDTVRWLINYARAHNQSPMITIKATRRNMHTTMVVTSTKRTYLFELKSFQHTYMAGIRFHYPQSNVMRLGAMHKKASTRSKPKAFAVPLSAIGSHFRIVVKDRKNKPVFTPRRAFVYGNKTYIEFPFQLKNHKIPTLFKLNRNKSAHQTQYVIDGHYMVVSEVIDHVMLKRHGQWVGLERKKRSQK